MGPRKGIATARWARLGLVVLIAALVSACGYQLRGSASVPAAMRSLTLDADASSALTRALRRHLQANGIQLSTGEATPYRLALLSEQHGRRAISLDDRAKTEEYELYSKAEFQVSDADGNTLLGPETLLIERVYTFDSNNVTAKDAERRLLRDEMLEQLSGQILRQYLTLGSSAP